MIRQAAERGRAARHDGLDAATGTYVDLVEAGIVDAKVVQLALENAVQPRVYCFGRRQP